MLSFTQSQAVNLSLLVLIVFSIATWTLIFLKGWAQWKNRSLNDDFKRMFWNASGLSEAESAAKTRDGVLARLCRAGFEALKSADDTKGKLGAAGDRHDILERSLRNQVQKEQHKLESGLMVLASIGSTAPFIGLFGTVWGIMHALKEISLAGSASLEVVAGPVGEALIATAIGIATAIPAVLAYNWGVRRVRLMVAELEQFAGDFLNLAVKADSGN